MSAARDPTDVLLDRINDLRAENQLLRAEFERMSVQCDGLMSGELKLAPAITFVDIPRHGLLIDGEYTVMQRAVEQLGRQIAREGVAYQSKLGGSMQPLRLEAAFFRIERQR